MKIDRKQIRYSLQLILHLQKKKVAKNQDGYAMLITSILTILMFSLLSVYLFSANLYKSVANAVVDSGTTFYAAESGMNERANTVRDKFAGFSQPTGTSPTGGTNIALQMQNCINNLGSSDTTTLGTGDLGCDVAEFDYRESAWKAINKDSFQETYDNNPNVKYRAYSFVNQLGGIDPVITKIPAGEPFAGLNMQEYKYRVYSTAIKSNAGNTTVSSQTLLQMDFNSRVIPLFQFAAFYEQDLEISSSSNMSLSGPIHSNSNVWLSPGGTLTAGQTTAARRQNDDGTWVGGKIYKSLNRVANYGYLDPGRRVILGSNTPIDVSDAWSTANTRITADEVNSSSGLLNEDTPRLDIPPVGFLSRTGNYRTKADLRVTLDPNNIDATLKFNVESIVNAASTTFSASMIRSLQNPVMLATTAHNGDTRSTEWNNLCVGDAKTGANFTAANFANNWNASVSAADTNASDALRNALAKSSTIYTFSELNNTKINALRGDLVAKIGSTLTTAQQNLTPRQIANQAGNCFLPAPMQLLTEQKDRQENRDMTILQTNIHSLTIWNRDGRYSDDGSIVLDAASKIFARKAELSSAPTGSYEWMGLAASDTTERGLVWHFSVDPAVTHTTNQSPYGFGFSGGRWLPGALTLATDQIAYIQGDFNNPGGVQPSTIGEDVFAGSGSAGAGISRNENLRQKKPSSVLADAIGVLSNNCADSNGTLNCFNIGVSSVASTSFTSLEQAVTVAAAAYNTANAAYDTASAAYNTANAAYDTASAAYNTANAAYNTADKAYNKKKTSANLAARNAALATRNAALATRDTSKATRDTALATRDTAKATRDTAYATWQTAIDMLASAVRDAEEAAAAASSNLPTATSTSINAAFLAGTANQSGLNNYMRMIENWGGSAGTSIFRYRGSFVSLGVPQKLNGAYNYGCNDASRCYYNIPGRDFGFDTSFNSSSGLPPLAPQVVYLKQKVFRRDYESDRTN
jgi:hypothetical protein